ncbi:MAG: PEGA domain-containing protein [Candidatus Eisenbacteria bacterium]|nr:PEGA domain-containing protein [Candidatus Eisenbacteria bacterium]
MSITHATSVSERRLAVRLRPPRGSRNATPDNLNRRSPRRNGGAASGLHGFRGLRLPAIASLAGCAGLILRCGQADPSIGPPLATGSIVVTSAPDSAAIYLDRLQMGLVTPDTLEEIPPGLHWVTVEKPGFTPMPCSLQVQVSAGTTASAHFELTAASPRPVLFESFTNTGCMPCAEANPMLYALVDGQGIDRVVLLEFHPGFPSPLDPFYLAQRVLMDGRVALNGVAQAPWLVVEGTTGLQPVSEQDVQAALAAAVPQNAVDLILAAQISGSALTCSLGAAAAVPGTYTLTVFAADDLEEFETAPGSNGEKEFRHVVRGVMPVPCGEEAELSSTVVWRVWSTVLSWHQEGEPVTIVAHARRSDSPVTVGLDVQQLP